MSVSNANTTCSGLATSSFGNSRGMGRARWPPNEAASQAELNDTDGVAADTMAAKGTKDTTWRGGGVSLQVSLGFHTLHTFFTPFVVLSCLPHAQGGLCSLAQGTYLSDTGLYGPLCGLHQCGCMLQATEKEVATLAAHVMATRQPEAHDQTNRSG